MGGLTKQTKINMVTRLYGHCVFQWKVTREYAPIVHLDFNIYIYICFKYGNNSSLNGGNFREQVGLTGTPSHIGGKSTDG